MDSKKILFICPSFYEYPKLIKSGLEKKGFYVDYFSTIPKNRFLKILFQLKISKQKILELYYNRVSMLLKKDYDFVFIIKGDEIPLWFMDYIKSNFRKSVFIQYNWDDIDFYPEIINRFSYFDKIYTYSQNDAIKYNLALRPFFFKSIDKLQNHNSVKRNIDIYIIASYNKIRYNFIPKFIKLNSHLVIRIFFYINPYMFIKEKIHLSRLCFFKYHKKSYEKMLNEISKSKAILDVPFENQKGLTTRSFESLSLGCKVITTNKNIINYDFYNKSNVLIIDEDNFCIDEKWLNSEFEAYDEKIINSYNLNAWINDIFN